MSRSRCLLMSAVILGMAATAGCQASRGSKVATVVTPGPAVVAEGDESAGPLGSSVDGPPARTVSAVDRHPLLRKPREYWETSGDNRLVKAAAATFIGVPAGVVGEVRQIFAGAPPEPRY